MIAERATLGETACELGLSLDENVLDQLLQYLDLLRKWNQVHNLTALRDPANMLSHHLLDSLSVVRPLDAVLGSAVSTARLLDVGSGAGLPGIVLAIVRPRLRVDCIDAVAKKVAFMRQAGVELQLPNLTVMHGRVEDLAGCRPVTRFDVVTARAFASLEKLVRVTEEVLTDGGVWLAMKAHVSSSEQQALPASIEVFHVEQLRVPLLHAERCIVWMRRRVTARETE